jgi:carboxylesterase type B
MTSYHHQHPILGRIQGRLDVSKTAGPQGDVVQFRSIPYANIPRRFAQSELLNSIPQHFDGRPSGDFTTFGAACPQMLPNADVYGGPILGEQAVTVDEMSCLNLTISAPGSVLQAGRLSKMLPVLVYVHGGALTEGTGGLDALHETTNLIHASIEEQMPVIIVSICYRLNWLGFMACQDLLDERRSEIISNAEGSFNLGFHDQRKAFLWVRNNIAGFGGDSDNITAFGESAGASSLICLMASPCHSSDEQSCRALPPLEQQPWKRKPQIICGS